MITVEKLLSGRQLGDVRGEFDHQLLESTFFESNDYKVLRTGDAHNALVVGRRGTGKSALAFRLNRDWRAEKRFVVAIAPESEEMVAMRALAELFGDRLMLIKSAIRLLWKYALLCETASKAEHFYKLTDEVNARQELAVPLRQWATLRGGPMEKLYHLFHTRIEAIQGESSRVAQLAGMLDLREPLRSLHEILRSKQQRVSIIIDRLDEGYEADIHGLGTADGLVAGTLEFQESLSTTCNVLVFVRDNIFRGIQEHDVDFSRNLEPRSIRLHWDPNELLFLVAKRIRYAFGLTHEADQKTWNSVTANELHGRDGFRGFLRHTLYRPRDVIDLINKGFVQSAREQRTTLTTRDLEVAATVISQLRFADLAKEYESVFPGLKILLDQTKFFGLVHFKREDIDRLFEKAIDTPACTGKERQHLEILLGGQNTAESLYSIGLIGARELSRNNYVFSHDGRPSQPLSAPDVQFMLHPCYWPAVTKNSDTSALPIEDIFDDYEVTIHSSKADERKRVLGQHIAALNDIPLGNEGAKDFENWCHKAVQYCFAQSLTNLELKANRDAPLRRDIVATNSGKSDTWKRILQDYNARQVTLEVKNYEELGVGEYRQVSAYLGREYGRFGIIICRSKNVELGRAAELQAFREFYKKTESFMIVKLTAAWLVTALSKLRSPQKYDHADVQLSKIIDSHIRVYANEGALSKRKHQK